MAALPPQSFGFIVISAGQGIFPQAGGVSDGTLCLAQNLGRLVGPGQVQGSGVSGGISVAVNLNNISPGIAAGTNFSSVVAVTFL